MGFPTPLAGRRHAGRLAGLDGGEHTDTIFAGERVKVNGLRPKGVHAFAAKRRPPIRAEGPSTPPTEAVPFTPSLAPKARRPRPPQQPTNVTWLAT